MSNDAAPVPNPTTDAARPNTSNTALNLHTQTESAAAQFKSAQKAEKVYREKKIGMAARKDWHQSIEHFTAAAHGFKEGSKCVGRVIKAGPVLIKEHGRAAKEELSTKRKKEKKERADEEATGNGETVKPKVPKKDKKEKEQAAASGAEQKKLTLDQVRERILCYRSRFREEEEGDDVVVAPRPQGGISFCSFSSHSFP